MKKYDNSLEHSKKVDWEFKLKFVSGADNVNDMSINHFASVKLALLQSFVRTRLVEYMWMLSEKDIPGLKGKIKDVGNATPCSFRMFSQCP